MIRGPSASQPISALCADLDRSNATPCVSVRFIFRGQRTGATLQWQVSVVRNLVVRCLSFRLSPVSISLPRTWSSRSIRNDFKTRDGGFQITPAFTT